MLTSVHQSVFQRSRDGKLVQPPGASRPTIDKAILSTLLQKAARLFLLMLLTLFETPSWMFDGIDTGEAWIASNGARDQADAHGGTDGKDDEERSKEAVQSVEKWRKFRQSHPFIKSWIELEVCSVARNILFFATY